MNLALDLARQAEALAEVPIGAVIVRDGEILGVGYNQTIGSCDPTAHAEMVAIRAAARRVNNHRLVGADLYVTIEPCIMCAGALVQARLKRLIFAAPEPRAGAVMSKNRVLETPGLNHRVEIESGVCQAEAAALMAGFFRVRR